MRTTIRLDEALLRKAKSVAAASGRSLNDFIADAVRAAVTPRASRGSGPAIPVFKGGSLLPGVDLDDSAGLLDLMDRPYSAESRATRAAEGPPRRAR
jgi:uncharacterized protein (DUF1778 family)